MATPRYALTAVACCFVLVLLYATLDSDPTPAVDAAGRAAAERACERAVSERVPGARFPFSSNLTGYDGERYRLSGTVDAGSPGETVRRNYECVVRADPSGSPVADTMRVWQSH